MDADKLKGMAVVSLNEGAKLGRIQDLLFDTQAMRVAAIQISGDNGGNFVLPTDQVRSIGADAVTVESGQVLQVAAKGGQYEALPGLGKLKGLKVVDGTGTLVGSVTSVEVDPVGGRLVGLTAHKGGMLGLGGTSTTIEAAAIRSIGPEVITVLTDAAPSASQG